MKVFVKLLVVTIALVVFPTQAAEEGGLRLLSFSTLLGEILTFAILVYVMVKFVWPPLMNAIETRQKEIADMLAAGEQGQQELADAAKEKSLLLEEARIKANEMVEEGEKRKNTIVDGAKREAEIERERILRQGQREVEVERLAMRQELEQNLGNLVIIGVGRILQREVDGTAHRNIIHSLKETFDDTPNSDTPDSDTSGSDIPDSDTSDSDTSDSDIPDSDTPDSDTPDSDTSDSDTSDSDTSGSDTSYSDIPNSDTPNSNTSTTGLIGGKRGSQKEKKNEDISRKRGSIDLVCQELPSQKWGIVIEKSEIIKCVRQGDEIEEWDGVYIIPKIENIEIFYANEEQARVIPLEKNIPLIFQIRKDWRGKGRKVKAISPHYHHVVFTPSCCGKRKNQSPPVEAEDTMYSGYRAHFFTPDKNIADDGFEHCTNIISGFAQFTLEGDLISDSHSMGKLFSTPPRLNDTDNFQSVSRVDIGDEGKSGWCESFNPREKKISDVLESRGGWFYVRVYDKQPSLIFSIDFRLLPGLKGITIDEKNNWQNLFMPPGDNGYPSAYVKFIVDKDITVHSEDIDIPESEKNNHVFSIPPQPKFDKTEWILKNGEGYEVNVSVILPRVWWRRYIGNDKEDWQSTPIQIKREDIYYASPKQGGVEISLPLLFEKKIDTGLDKASGKPFNPVIADGGSGYKRLSKLPLSEFAYHRDLENPIASDAFLHVWTDAEIKSFPIIQIPADNPPLSSKNKRYSKLELINAEICYTSDTLIRVDKRRQTCHEANIQILRRIYNAR